MNSLSLYVCWFHCPIMFLGKKQREKDYTWKKRGGKDKKETYYYWNTGELSLTSDFAWMYTRYSPIVEFLLP